MNKVARLNQCLLRNEDQGATKEITVVCYDARGNKILKEDGSEDTMVFGVLDSHSVTWGQKKRLSGHYIDFDAIADLKKEDYTGDEKIVDYARGDEERLCFYVKYCKDEDGHRNLSKSDIIALPEKMVEQIDEHIPSSSEILRTIKYSRKKKSRG